MERCGKINAVNSGSESWTGIGVVAGCAVVMLITQGPHVQDIATYWRIKLLHILQEVGSICKTRNHLLVSLSVSSLLGFVFPLMSTVFDFGELTHGVRARHPPWPVAMEVSRVERK